jgi:4-hydroxy-tetrahydrodipicolinate synthase
MSEAKFHGVIPAMATPFAADESFDEMRCIEMIDWYLDCGVHGISVAGSQGEFFSLEEKEHMRLIELAVERINGRVPLYAGTGRITTRETIRVTKAAEAMGADLSLVITPFFVQPSQSELIEHYGGSEANQTPGHALQQSAAHQHQRAAIDAAALYERGVEHRRHQGFER